MADSSNLRDKFEVDSTENTERLNNLNLLAGANLVNGVNEAEAETGVDIAFVADEAAEIALLIDGSVDGTISSDMSTEEVASAEVDALTSKQWEVMGTALMKELVPLVQATLTCENRADTDELYESLLKKMLEKNYIFKLPSLNLEERHIFINCIHSPKILAAVRRNIEDSMVEALAPHRITDEGSLYLRALDALYLIANDEYFEVYKSEVLLRAYIRHAAHASYGDRLEKLEVACQAMAELTGRTQTIKSEKKGINLTVSPVDTDPKKHLLEPQKRLTNFNNVILDPDNQKKIQKDLLPEAVTIVARLFKLAKNLVLGRKSVQDLIRVSLFNPMSHGVQFYKELEKSPKSNRVASLDEQVTLVDEKVSVQQAIGRPVGSRF